MTSLSGRTVARLSSPGDIVATVPVLCGFVPQDSVVVLSLRGERRRVGLTVRSDLPLPEAQQALAEMLAGRIAHDGAIAAVVVVYSELAQASDLVEAIATSFGGSGIVVTEALHVGGGRWTSYLCSRPCCPADGTAVPPVPSIVEAESALDGRAVLSSRAELARSLAPPTSLAAAAADRRLAKEQSRWSDQVRGSGLEAARVHALASLRASLDAVASGHDG